MGVVVVVDDVVVVYPSAVPMGRPELVLGQEPYNMYVAGTESFTCLSSWVLVLL